MTTSLIARALAAATFQKAGATDTAALLLSDITLSSFPAPDAAGMINFKARVNSGDVGDGDENVGVGAGSQLGATPCGSVHGARGVDFKSQCTDIGLRWVASFSVHVATFLVLRCCLMITICPAYIAICATADAAGRTLVSCGLPHATNLDWYHCLGYRDPFTSTFT